MFSSLRNRFGIPGVISVFALVFAMFGGAYAANNSSSDNNGSQATASAKAKKGPKGAKGAKGDTGPAGPAGPAGPKGDTGAAGAAGAAGAKGATGATGPTGPTGATGATGVTGTDGSPWTVGGELPSGETLTGAWAVNDGYAAAGQARAPISFSIPLETGLAAENVHPILPSGEEETELGPAPPTQCAGGSVVDPQAAPGHLCVYASEMTNAFYYGIFAPGAIERPDVPGNVLGAGKTGAVLRFFVNAGGLARGTYAVTAP